MIIFKVSAPCNFLYYYKDKFAGLNSLKLKYIFIKKQLSLFPSITEITITYFFPYRL